MTKMDAVDAYLFETGPMDTMAHALQMKGLVEIELINGKPKVGQWEQAPEDFARFERAVSPSGLQREFAGSAFTKLLERYYALIYPNQCDTRGESMVISAFNYALCEDYSEIAIADFFDGWAANHRRWPTWFETKRELDARMELIGSVCDQIRSQIAQEVAANDDGDRG